MIEEKTYQVIYSDQRVSPLCRKQVAKKLKELFGGVIIEVAENEKRKDENNVKHKSRDFV